MSDLINRQDAIDAINKAFERVFAWDGTSPLGDKVLENVPSAERKRGEWIEDGYQGYPCVCSVCGIAQDIKAKFLFSFCPNCGARMVSI